MKRLPITMALLALAAGPALAQSSVTVAGVADLAARNVTNEDRGTMQSLANGGNATSRLIFRGVEDLGGGLSASFHLEHGLLLDNGESAGSTFWDRRATLSLVSKSLGELRLGRDYIPSYTVWSRHDPFSHVGVAGSGNFTSATPTGPIRSAFGSNLNTTQRASNTVAAYLPGGLGGFAGHVMVAAGEGGAVASGSAKVMGVLLGWAGGPVAVAAAFTQTENELTTNGSFDDTVVGGAVTWGPARINLAWRQYQQADSKQTNVILSTTVTLGQGEIKASYLMADMAGQVGSTVIDANDAQQIGVGYVYNVSKRTALYATASFVDNEGAATFVVPGGPSGIAGGKRSTGYEFGIRHNF